VTLVDSNVLIDIWTDDPQWYDWSLTRLNEAGRSGPLLINDIIYAEASIRFRSMDDFDAALAEAGVTVTAIPRMALFLAGKAFAQYRSAGGTRTGVLPDFFIGAHADLERLPLLTRDVPRYRHYFPTVELIAPDAEE
jgi:predicted nucleic acid-binding protein